MKTIGRDKWPDWVKEVIDGRKNIEIKENNGNYYAYKSKSSWDKEKKKPTRTSIYLGAVKPSGIKKKRKELKGIYEYGHVKYVQHLLGRKNILAPLKKAFPDDWPTLLCFALNRLIEPRPIKSIRSWYEKTYLAKQLDCPMSPKTISKVLERVGKNWNSQLQFFHDLRENGEKVLYDGSVIFSESSENALTEMGYNKDQLLLPQAKIVMAFSKDRFIPILFRVIPGSIHDIKTLEVLRKEIGNNLILIMDKGLNSKQVRKDLSSLTYIMPLSRDSRLIDYNKELNSYFLYKDRPIKFTSWKEGKQYIYLYEDISLRAEEEKTYYQMLSKGKQVEFKEERAGKIALISNREFEPEQAYRMWKDREQIEKAFHTLQNILDADKPWVHKKEVFRGYLFGSFLSLLTYYLILQELKRVGINDKVSVKDLLLELSKIYKVEVGGEEVLSELNKKVRKMLEKLEMKNLITKNG